MVIQIPTEISLTEGEVPIWFGHMSWIAIWPILLFGAFFALGGLFSLFSFNIGGFIAYFFIALIFLVPAWIAVMTSEYFVSNTRIFVKYGFISRVMNDIKMEWVTNTSLSQGFVGRLLNYGNVVIATPGTITGTTEMRGVGNPIMIKGMIEERLVKYKKINEIRQSIRTFHDAYILGQIDKARYDLIIAEKESEIRKYS